MIRSVFLRNVGLSSILKLTSFLLQFAMLPVLIKSLGQAEYGVWVALQSLVVWVSLLDFGISKGLRNRLIGLLSLGEEGLAKRYISSTFYGQWVLSCGIAVAVAYLLFFLGLPWAKWFKSQATDDSIALSCFYGLLVLLMNQTMGVVNAILYAKHWNAATSLVGFFASLGLLLYASVSVWLGSQVTLPELGMVNFLLFAVGYAIQSFFVFGKLPSLIPEWNASSWGMFYEVAGLGVRFLLIEFTFLVIFMMDRWIVLQVLGPSAVTEYDILMRLSALVTTGYSLCTGPLWALSGTAWTKRDHAMMDKLWGIATALMIPFALVAIVIGIAINPVVHIWIDSSITISPEARISMVFYSWVVIWGTAYASLLNGIGRVREQMLCSIAACLINIPLAIYLCGVGRIGIAGVLIASTVSLSLFSIVAPFVWFECRDSCKQNA